MDALCGLFDAVAGVGEIFSRPEEKSTEVETLQSTINMMNQAVRTFAEHLSPTEREEAFHSNQVFSQLSVQLNQCKAIVDKHRGTLQRQALTTDQEERRRLEDGELAGTASTASSWAPSAASAALRKGLRKSGQMMQEGLEVVSGKLGGLGSLVLPEDELDVIRKAIQELTRLVPLVNLAIQVFGMRGQKRPAPGPLDMLAPARPLQEPRRLSTASTFAEISSDAGGASMAVDVPEVGLRLVSDHPAARSLPQLPSLSANQLRPCRAVSTMSLDSGSEPAGVVKRLVFGRQELRDKVPRQITLTPKGSEEPQPLMRFVSRELFALDVALPPPEPEIKDSLDMQTLTFGEETPHEFECATLAWGAGCDGLQPMAPKAPLASVLGISAAGLHLRSAGETRWRWLQKESKVEVYEGDRIAILLESPPGSASPGPSRDLEAEEAMCLLGIELQPPPVTAPSR